MRLLRAGFAATPIQRPNVEPLPCQLLASVCQMAVCRCLPGGLETSSTHGPLDDEHPVVAVNVRVHGVIDLLNGLS